MKTKKVQELKGLLQDKQDIDMDALSDEERHWLSERNIEIKEGFIRIICRGDQDATKAKEILKKVTGDRVQITRIIVGSDKAKENLKKLMEG